MNNPGILLEGRAEHTYCSL